MIEGLNITHRPSANQSCCQKYEYSSSSVCHSFAIQQSNRTSRAPSLSQRRRMCRKVSCGEVNQSIIRTGGGCNPVPEIFRCSYISFNSSSPISQSPSCIPSLVACSLSVGSKTPFVESRSLRRHLRSSATSLAVGRSA